MNPVDVISKLVTAAVEGRRAEAVEGLGEEDWKLILGIAAAQKIHPFIFDALPETGVPESVVQIWEAQARANEYGHSLIEAVAKAQEAAWNKEGIGYALLKGPSVATLYPVPSHRGCGDLDWWFGDERGWKAALEAARRNVGCGIHRDSDGDINYTFNDVVIEHHRDWTHLSSRRLRKLAGKPSVDGGRLSPGDTILTLLCHILHHLAWEGVNLKQFIDLSIALRRYDGSYDKTVLKAKLNRMGLDRWASLVSEVLVDLTGLPPQMAMIYTSVPQRNVSRLMGVIFEAKPKFSDRLRLMWSSSGRECAARYWYLISGKFLRL